jgi:hypothetical protein
MSGLNKVARIVLRLANWIAGSDRENWILAMAAETEAADHHGTEWALGCLRAAAKDRVARDRWFVAAIVALPALAMLLTVTSIFVIFLAARAFQIPDLAIIPVMLFAPLPAAWLLGRMRPEYSAVVVGTTAFVVHQAGPLLTMWALFGRLAPFWSPNMVYYNMPAPAGLLASWLVWMAATWWGASTRRTTVA